MAFAARGGVVGPAAALAANELDGTQLCGKRLPERRCRLAQRLSRHNVGLGHEAQAARVRGAVSR
jgi:hypothetical protein